MSYNVASAIKGLCLNPQERTARFKKYRLLLVHVSGRMSRSTSVMRLRLCASEQTIARLRCVWKVFELATNATRTIPPPTASVAVCGDANGLSGERRKGHRSGPRFPASDARAQGD